MKRESRDRIAALGVVFLLSMLILCPIRDISSEEAESPGEDNTVSEGYEVIREARDNKKSEAEDDRDADGERAAGEAPPDEAGEADSASAQDGRAQSLTAKETPSYDSAGKRDPFKPFLKLVDIPAGPSPVIRPPIQRYPLNQFRIAGIVWIGGEPKAMIVDPEANTYFLGVGDKIGDKEGVILEVRDSGLLVQERTRLENVYGEVRIEVKKSVLAFQNEE